MCVYALIRFPTIPRANFVSAPNRCFVQVADIVNLLEIRQRLLILFALDRVCGRNGWWVVEKGSSMFCNG